MAGPVFNDVLVMALLEEMRRAQRAPLPEIRDKKSVRNFSR
jgi:hypothetical protein